MGMNTERNRREGLALDKSEPQKGRVCVPREGDGCGLIIITDGS